MRHIIIRFSLGFLFLACLLFSLVTANFSFSLLYFALSAIFLWSAYSLWKQDKNNRR